MKKILALVLALVMVMGLVACGGDKAPETTAPQGNDAPETTAPQGDAPETTAPVAANVDYKVAMITDYGDITDQSFNQTTYEACKEYCDANGITFTYYKPNGDADAERIAMIDAAIADGYNIIVMPGFAFGNAIKAEAELYPDVLFFALDVGAGDFGDWTLPSNVYSAVYQEELSGYMAGYAAVKLGYKHLGFLGGMAVPAVVRFGYGFLQGADAAAADLGISGEVVVEYVYGGAFQGDADITAVMDTWYGEMGVECVFASGGGIFTSAAEAAAKVGGKVIGVDVDQSAIIDPVYGEGMTVTSAMKGLAPTVKDTLADIIENNNWANYAGQIVTLGLISADPEVNYVQIPMDTTQWSDAFTQEDYKALVAAMFDGTLTVSNDIENMPATAITVNTYDNIK